MGVVAAPETVSGRYESAVRSRRAKSPSRGDRRGAGVSARSRMKVDRVSFHAFQYRWNWSSDVAADVMLRQTMRSEAASVRAFGSSETVMV